MVTRLTNSVFVDFLSPAKARLAVTAGGRRLAAEQIFIREVPRHSAYENITDTLIEDVLDGYAAVEAAQDHNLGKLAWC